MKIDKQELSRQMQGLLGAVLSIKGEDIVELKNLGDKLSSVTSKIEEDIFYLGNPDHIKTMNYKFHFIKK